MAASMYGQWNPTSMQGGKLRPETQVKNYYTLDLQLLKTQLSVAVEAGKGNKPVIINLPTLGGTIEKFAVYSAPVVVKSLADKYQLGSYAGVSITDPTKSVRLSLSPDDFQSMVFSDGNYEFIEPQNTSKTIYGVFPKTNRTDTAFECSTTESFATKAELDKLRANATASTQNNIFSKNSDQKFRTYRLAISVTGEYTTFFGGVPKALAAINATMTRVNGVFEKDFAIRMILQDFPELIYTNASTDPYSAAGTGAGGAWSRELQRNLTTVIGNDAYDIGHLFGRSGGGGSAGDIGNVCRNPSNANDATAKGSAFTSPGSGDPVGDNFDIDYVAHEMGHQFGADHTFSHALHGAPNNSAHMEPGSGSTIMSYAGITAANVQMHSDPYFLVRSLEQVQTYVNTQSCDVNTAITNTPPVIEAMANKTIPKGTAFVLTANATDAENDALTYTWEEYDRATSPVTNVTGNNLTGAKFRSRIGTSSPSRYFPKLSLVLDGTLSSAADWEAVSNVARATNFKVTVRDNNPDVAMQQTAIGAQNLTVGSDGPFKITSDKVYNNVPGPLTWDVANTSAAPYGVENVKIDYTIDNGATWEVLAESTPNDGSEDFGFSTFATNTQLKVRISAIGNVFYAVAPVVVSAIVACDGTAPAALAITNVTTGSAVVSWDPIASATYILKYKMSSASAWTEVPLTTNSYNLIGLDESSTYNVEVAAVCTGTVGTFAAVNFTTLMIEYCTLVSNNSDDEYISNVTITGELGLGVNSTSGASNYTNYSSNPARLVRLVQGSTNNVISVSKTWTGSQYSEGVSVWIDFNRNGTYEESEKVMSIAANTTTPVTATFAVPADAYIGEKTVGMRVALRYNANQTTPCGTFSYGEVEDYAVKISATMGVNDTAKSQQIQVYPNPAIDVLNVTKVNGNASYTIYNMAGQAVAKGKVSDNKVAVSALVKGVYIIAIDSNDEVTKVKFIKK